MMMMITTIWLLTMVLLGCCPLSCFTVANTTTSIDPLELDQDWEIAIRQVLIVDSQPNINNRFVAVVDVDENVTLSTLYSVSSSSSITVNLSDASNITTTTTDRIITIVEDPSEEEENDRNDDKEFEHEEGSSSVVVQTESPSTKIEYTKSSQPSSDNEIDEDESADDEDSDQSPRGLADRLRPLLQEWIANSRFRQLNFTRSTSSHTSSSEANVWSNWATLLETISSEASVLTRSVITPIVMDAFFTMPDLSSNCSNGLMAFGNALQASELWAVRMIDSNGHLPSGILSGTSASFGDFDQCLSIRETDPDTHQTTVQGKYCLLELGLPVPELQPNQRLRFDLENENLDLMQSIFVNQTSNFQLRPNMAKWLRRGMLSFYSTKVYNGLCTIAVCSASDLEVLFKNFLGDAIQVQVSDCQVQEAPQYSQEEQQHGGSTQSRLKTSWTKMVRFYCKLDTFQRVSLYSLIICVSLIMMATLLDLCSSSSKKTHAHITICAIYIRSFSMRSNWNSLFRLQSVRSKDNKPHSVDLRFINGIRALAMLWIVTIHVGILGTLFAPMLVYRFEEEARTFGRSLLMQFIYNGYASVELFFFLSGFVLVFITLSSKKAESSSLLRVPSLSLYFGIRALRLVIPMAGLLALHYLWPLLSSGGPFFLRFSAQLIDSCRNNYWKNLLLINNYDRTPDVCLVHTWFLSADFQLHLLAYPLVLLFSLNETLGLLLNVGLILSGAIIPSYLIYHSGAPPTLSAFIEVLPDHFYADMQNLYYPVYMHLSGYFTGFLFGYLLLRQTRAKTQQQSITSLDLKMFLNVNSRYSRKLTFWLCSMTVGTFVVGAGSIFLGYVWTREEGPLVHDELAGVLYFGLHRLAFLVFPVWVVWMCVKFPKNFLHRFLSVGPFQILGRLSFSIYMVHILFVWYFLITTRTLIRFQLSDLIFNTGGVLMYTIPGAIAFHLVLEAPFSRLIKHFQGYRSVDDRSRNNQHENNNNNNKREHKNSAHSSSDSFELYLGGTCTSCGAQQQQPRISNSNTHENNQ